MNWQIFAQNSNGQQFKKEKTFPTIALVEHNFV